MSAEIVQFRRPAPAGSKPPLPGQMGEDHPRLMEKARLIVELAGSWGISLRLCLALAEGD